MSKDEEQEISEKTQTNLPYMIAYRQIPKLLDAIKRAAQPPKYTTRFVAETLGLKSNNMRASVSFLKRLGFIDENSVPTPEYSDLRSSLQEVSGAAIARGMRRGFAELYKYDEKCHENPAEEKIKDYVARATNLPADNPTVYNVTKTFMALVQLADFEASDEDSESLEDGSSDEEIDASGDGSSGRQGTGNRSESSLKGGQNWGLSYTFNINLPATNDTEIYHAIFRALKEELL